jgi:peptide/nickel transport system substrate-binding protein
MKKLLFILIAVILITGAIFTGCEKTTPATTTQAATTAVTTTTAAPTPAKTTVTPQYGGVLKIISNPGIINIGVPGVIAASNDGSYRQPALEQLLRYDPEGKGQVIPHLCTDWKYSPDYTSLTMTLRKGVTFHDGTNFDATAAKFSLDMVLDSTFPELKTVSSIDVVDDYTIRLNLKSFDSALLSSIASQNCPMVSPKAINDLGKDASQTHPVGTGAFMFESYTRDVSLKYKKFEDYWQKGMPYLDGLEFVLIADPVVRLASLQAGEAHILRAVPNTDAAALKETGKYNTNTVDMATNMLFVDSVHSDSPFSKLKVRQAIAYALDNAAIAKAVGLGFFVPTNQLMSPMNINYNPNIKGYPYNVEKAKQLLNEAGYPNGFDTKLSYRAGAFEGDFCTLVQGYLKVIGINVQVDLADAARYNDLRAKGFSNQMVLGTFPQGPEKDFSFYFRERLSKQAKYFSSVSVFYPDDYNDKVFTINTERDEAKRIALLKEVGLMAVDTYLLTIPVEIETAVTAVSTQVQDCDYYKAYAMNYCPEKYWLKK